MPRRRLRIAVVGAGRIGALHAGLLASRVAGVELAAVADIDLARARRLAARFHVAALGVEDALGSDVDAVAVCASTPALADLAAAAAAAGRHVFCEKPLALDLATAERAIAAADRAGVLLHVGFNRRFDPSHAAVREAVVSGAVGDVHLVRITSRDPKPPPPGYAVPGGILLDTTVHDFDMARFVSGSEVVDAFARGAGRLGPWEVDTAVVVLGHADGTITTIDNSWQAVYGYDQRVEVFGSKGMAFSGPQLEHQTLVWGTRGARSARLQSFFAERYAASYARQWAAFVEAVRSGGPAPVDGRSARAALAIGLAARQSIADGRTVRVAEVEEVGPVRVTAPRAKG